MDHHQSVLLVKDTDIVSKNVNIVVEDEHETVEYVVAEEIVIEEGEDEVVAAYCDVNTVNVVENRKTFTCSVCGKEFDQKNSLTNHVKSHTNKKNHICLKCNKSFKKSGDYQRHMTLCGSEHKFKCDSCGKSFMSSNSLANHVKTHSDIKLWKCNICRTRFKKEGDMRNHTVMCSTGVLPYVCGICGKKFALSNALANHSHVHNQEIINCVNCGRKFKKEGSHAKYEAICETSEKFSCEVCDMKLGSEEQFKRHEKNHVNEKVQCDICFKSFSNLKCLTTHKKSHIELRYNCVEEGCSHIFKNPISLKKHIKSHKEPKNLDCHICGRTFGGAWNLKRHILTHEGVKPFQCSKCGKSFTCEKDMLAHSVVHSGIKGFSCSSCPSSFTHLRGLQQHQVLHTETAQSCNFGCGKKFLNTKQLTAHNLRCRFNLTLERSNNITSKIRDDLIFRCTICNSKFTCYEEIQKHVTSHKKVSNSIKDQVVISVEMPESGENNDWEDEINTFVVQVNYDNIKYEIESHVKYVTNV